MITRMDNLEGNMNELKELKNTVSTAELTKWKKEYQKSKINSMK